MKMGWIGVDLDGTLARYDEWRGVGHIGEPVEKMVSRVKAWLDFGREVRIFTARVYTDGSPARNIEVEANRRAIEAWCIQHIGARLPVTCVKDYEMIELWDDRAVSVQKNTGKAVSASPPDGSSMSMYASMLAVAR